MSISIKVSGNKFVDGAGVALTLHGANCSALEFVAVQQWSPNDPWGGQKPNLAAMQAWGINAIRVPLNAASYLGLVCAASAVATTATVKADPGGNYKQAVKAIVDDATAHGMVVILDLHKCSANYPTGLHSLPDTSGQGEMADVDTGIPFWTQLATDYKGYGNVVFDLFNEPHIDNFVMPTNLETIAGYSPEQVAGWQILRDGGTGKVLYANNAADQTQWKSAGMQALLSAVRNASATNVVIIGGPSWANLLDLWEHFKPVDPLNQLAISWHAYETPGQASGLPSFGQVSIDQATALMQKYPIIVGETGDESGNGYLTKLLTWAKGFDGSIGTFVWTWDTGFGGLSLITDHATGAPAPGQGVAYKSFLAASPVPVPTPVPTPTPIGKVAVVKLTLPVKRTDGSAVTSAVYGGAKIYKNGNLVKTIMSPTTTFTDTIPAAEGDTWTAKVFDTQSPPVDSALSAAAVVVAAPSPAPTPLAPLMAPGITVTLQ